MVSNIERTRELRRQSYCRHAIEINERAREKRKNNPNTTKNKDREHYQKYKERILKRAKEYCKKNPEWVLMHRERHRERNRHSVFWSRAKKSAKEQGVEFDLTKEWIKQRLDIGACEMTGISFDMKGKRTPDSPSIDRVIPGGNYTMDNCRIILWSLNRALNNWGEEYFLKIFQAMNKKSMENAIIDATITKI